MFLLGVTQPTQAAASYLLDAYSADLAFSTRQLKADATLCMRVRRASDNTTLDVGFVAGYIDTASAASFGSGTTLWVVTWYDQSGNNNHLYNNTAGEQPNIYTGGAFTTFNGKVALDFPNGSDEDLNLTTPIVAMASGYTAFNVGIRSNSTQYSMALSGAVTNSVATGLEWFDGSFYFYNTNRYFYCVSGTTTESLWTTKVAETGATGALLHINGVNKTISNAALGKTVNFDNYGQRGGNHVQGKYPEFIQFMSQLDGADITAIETDIITYYGL